MYMIYNIYIYTYLKWHICTQCAAIVKIKRHPLLLGTSLVCQFGTKRSNMASFESAWLGFGPHDIEVPNLHTYIYIYIFEYVKKTRGICTVLSRVLARVFPIYQLFLWCISLTLDTLRNRPFPVRLGHMAISEDPNLEESIHFFRPQPDDLYIYIYNRYLCHCVICISTTCFVKSGGPIPQTNTYPSEDHGI